MSIGIRIQRAACLFNQNHQAHLDPDAEDGDCTTDTFYENRKVWYIEIAYLFGREDSFFLLHAIQSFIKLAFGQYKWK
jgi:hypothetical protein